MPMWNVHNECDAWMLLMDLSDIKQEMLDRLEKGHEQEFPQNKKQIVGLEKKRYIALKVIKTSSRLLT